VGDPFEASVLLAVAFVALLAVICRPLTADGTEDRGDGLGVVRIPRPTKTPSTRPRTWAFLLAVVVLTVALVGLRNPSLFGGYQTLVRLLGVAVTGSPTRTASLVERIHPTLTFLIALYFLALAAVMRGDVGRRWVLAAHAVLYLATNIVLQAGIVGLAVGVSPLARPFGFESLVLDLVLGALVNARAIFTTFVLPRGTALAKTRPAYRWDTVLALCTFLSVVCLAVIAFSWLALQPADDFGHVLLPIYGATLIFVLSPLLLLPFGPVSGQRPSPRYDLPIDVITPAYNEAAGIEATLASIDRAALRYGGPVRIFVSNDGSSDDTESLALAAIARLRAAEGFVISAPNSGKARALNRALARTSAPVVVRIDGDCEMGVDALGYTAGWFADPSIGSVGALMMPRDNVNSWFHKLRGLECLFQFGLARRGAEVVDGMIVIPGTYTAFRRSPAVAMGGFVDGMNGEDSELTMQLGRMGYRAVLDPRVRCFEDVPPTVGEFLEQRTRWNRGGLHVAARHSPARSGLAGPRVWLWLVRRMFTWLSIVLGLIGPVYLSLTALLEPDSRRTVVTIAALYVLAAGLYLAVSVVLCAYYRQWRLLPWILTWYPFALLRRVAMLEALLSLPVRPLPRLRRPAQAVVPDIGAGPDEPERLGVMTGD
jgi:cellulose synthase/poly-beta-1,6-N-acetylglucosamine synthase-like glycosyltransferase